MTLVAPHYIRATRIQDKVLRYRWDDWDLNADEEKLDKGIALHLSRLSQRASLAFTIATTEWMVYRYGLLLDEQLPWQYLEAAWAQTIDWRYGALTIEGDTDAKEWTGPIRRPI